MEEQKLPAEALAQKQQLLAGKTISGDVIAVVNSITALAMMNTDVIHIHPRFFGHTNSFSISVNPADTNYQEGCDQPELMRELLYLDDDGSLEELLSIESNLTELVIEAREQAEVSECNTQQ